MPFIVIKGRFKPTVGIPDGDTVRFKADNLALWKKLQGVPVRLGKSEHSKNTVQLRFEGIDAIEKRPLSRWLMRPRRTYSSSLAIRNRIKSRKDTSSLA